MKGVEKKNLKTILIFLLPGLFIYTMFTVVPIIQASYYSLFDWSGGLSKEFLGLGNYHEIFSSPEFWGAFKNNIMYVVFCCIGQVGIGFFLAILLINRPKLRIQGLFRSALYVPCILAPVVIGFLGLLIYNARIGIINVLLTSIGLESLTKDWLGDVKTVIYSLIALHIWQYIGYYTIIFLSASQAIPEELMEVSDLDGAIGWKKTRYIIAPLLKDTIKVTLIVCVAGTMKVFDQIFVMTKGGPGTSSEVLTLFMYNNTFANLRYGFGSAVSIIIVMISFVMIVAPQMVVNRMQSKEIV